MNKKTHGGRYERQNRTERCLFMHLELLSASAKRKGRYTNIGITIIVVDVSAFMSL